MARVYGLTKKLERHLVDEKLAKEIIGNGDLVDITVRMEKLLDPGITYQIRARAAQVKRNWAESKSLMQRHWKSG